MSLNFNFIFACHLNILSKMDIATSNVGCVTAQCDHPKMIFFLLEFIPLVYGTVIVSSNPDNTNCYLETKKENIS